ncbi:MAG TPA: VTT domain-containing protein [Candidatus Sulfotelmatobacter sp.]|nr:VTT domain-containing protein [Candidatus Sulfotelmatobacter sp.]
MFNVEHIITAGGVLLVGAMIFAESGMFMGFFFPGDTLLIGAGVLASTGKLNLALLIVVVSIAAIAGDNTGYHIGKRWGRKLFSKPDSPVFRREYVNRAETFYEKHGNKTMLIAHFIPVIRTFTPPVAGVANMRYPQFVLFDAIGDIAWAVIVTLVGYWFGKKIPNLDHYILFAVFAVVVITLAPTIYHLSKAYLETRRLKSKKKSD